MGMGGSSLFPEVLAPARSGAGAPTLHVLDTTDPDAIARLGARLRPDPHLPRGGVQVRLDARDPLPPGLGVGAQPRPGPLRRDHRPRQRPGRPGAPSGASPTVWENRPDIGGRYSALSLFGVVPGLLAGVDVAGTAGPASDMAERLRASAAANPAARLAATMAAGVRQGRDKLTLVVPDESPRSACGSSSSSPSRPARTAPASCRWSASRRRRRTTTATTGCSSPWATTAGELDALAEAGHPVMVLPFGGEFADLGGQVLLWELATALAGALLGIQPFDQPDVAAAKAATPKVLAEGPPTCRPRRSTTCSRRSSRATTWPSRRSSTPARPPSAASRPPGSPCATG